MMQDIGGRRFGVFSLQAGRVSPGGSALRRTVVSIAVLAVLTATANAEPRGAAHPQPTPSPSAAETNAGEPDDPVRTANKARLDAFDARIAKNSERAMRSICAGCDGPATRTRPSAPRRAVARAGAVDAASADVVVDEPAEAAAD